MAMTVLNEEETFILVACGSVFRDGLDNIISPVVLPRVASLGNPQLVKQLSSFTRVRVVHRDHRLTLTTRWKAGI